jgi:hypothetical protein
LLRNSFRYASKKDWAAIAKDLKPVYTAPSEQAALDRFAEFSEKWEKRYPAIIRLWTNAWARTIPAIRPGHPHGHLHHQRHREHQRPHPARRQRPRTLPERAGRTEVRLPRDHKPGPHRQGPQTLVQPLESRPQRLRDHLRRTPVHRQELTPNKIQLHRFLDRWAGPLCWPPRWRENRVGSPGKPLGLVMLDELV